MPKKKEEYLLLYMELVEDLDHGEIPFRGYTKTQAKKTIAQEKDRNPGIKISAWKRVDL